MSSITCERCHELLDVEWDGEALAEADGRALREHLDGCVSCQRYRLEMAAVVNTAATLKAVEYDRPVELSPLVLRPRSTRPLFAGLLAASGVAAAFVIGLWLGRSDERSGATAPVTQVVRLVVPAAQAKRVEVVGDFTGWQKRLELTPTAGGLWVGEVKVPPGRYKYMIVVDDAALQPDPAAVEEVDDGFGGKNSVLDVGSI